MKKLMIAVIVVVVVGACSKSVPNMTHTSSGSTSIDCSGIMKSFSTDVRPVIQSSCAIGSNCHAAGSLNGPGELVSEPEVAAASAQIRAAVLAGTMPKTGSLTTSEKTAIVCWIENGAANN